MEETRNLLSSNRRTEMRVMQFRIGAKQFTDLVRFILGDTGVPYNWEYGDPAGKS